MERVSLTPSGAPTRSESTSTERGPAAGAMMRALGNLPFAQQEAALAPRATPGEVVQRDIGDEAEAEEEASLVTHSTVRQAASGASNRTTVGIGEQVNFSATRSGRWTASGGPDRRGNGSQFSWIAPSVPGSFTITFTSGRQSESKEFRVVKPSGVRYRKINEAPWGDARAADLHLSPFNARAGMTLAMNLEPRTVSFFGVGITEISGDATRASGYFETHAPPPHNATDSASYVEEDNSLPGGDVAALVNVRPPFSQGYFQFAIPLIYELSGAVGQLETVYQRNYLAPSGQLRVEKGGQVVTGGPAGVNPDQPPPAAAGGRRVTRGG